MGTSHAFVLGSGCLGVSTSEWGATQRRFHNSAVISHSGQSKRHESVLADRRAVGALFCVHHSKFLHFPEARRRERP